MSGSAVRTERAGPGPFEDVEGMACAIWPAQTHSRDNSVRWKAAALACLMLWAFVYIHQASFLSPTPASRVVLLRSLVTLGTLRIDQWHKRTPDKARVGEHYYSDKAPGTVVLALPAAWAAAVWVERQGLTRDGETAWLVTSWMACAWSQAIPAAVGAGCVFMWLARFVGERLALVTVVALWLGSLPLPYATALFSHAQVIGLVGVTIWGMDVFSRGRQRKGRAAALGRAENGASRTCGRYWRLCVAGVCLGLAVASEYTSGDVALALAVYAVLWRPTGRWWFLLPCAWALLLIPAYSWATIGTPFDLPYSFQAQFPAMQEGLYAIKWPDLENLLRLLFGPTRGLVFWSPVLVMTLAGWCIMAREKPGWLWLTYAVPVVHVVIISGRTWDWQAGATMSARFMGPIIPLLALPCALGLRRWPRCGGILALTSVGMMTLATLTDACPDYTVYNPLTELHIPKLLAGEVSYNLGTEVLGLSPFASMVGFYGPLISGMCWLWHMTVKADKVAVGQARMDTNEHQ